MLDTFNPEVKEQCGDAWELIPWFVNGTLTETEKEHVSRHIQSSPEFAAEVARQFALAKRVATEDPFEAPLARSLKSLKAQIRAEESASSSPDANVDARGNPVWRSPVAQWFEDYKAQIMLSGAGLAACAAAAVMIFPDLRAGNTTLTAAKTAVIRFQPASDLSDENLKSLLARNGLTLVSGPSESGVYTATLPAPKDPAAAVNDLLSTPDIVFAAPDTRP